MLLVAASAVASALLMVAGDGLGEWVFFTVVLSAGALTGWAALRSLSQAVRQRRAVARLRRVDPSGAARAAVRVERDRLSRQISAGLSRTLAGIADDAERALHEDDPSRALRSIHEQARGATSELRRQLGLLRETPDQPGGGATDDPAGAVRRRRVGRADLVLAALAATLALVESVGYSLLAQDWVYWPIVILTVLAASTVLGRTVAPAAAVLAAAGLLVGGWLTSVLVDLAVVPIIGGFWWFASFCVLVWTIGVHAGRSVAELLSVAFFIATAVTTIWLIDPANVPITILVLVGALATGLATGWWRRQARHAGGAIADREAVLEEARRAAVDAERLTMARDVHDVVSHGVGVIAMQAAAAQVCWPQQPESMRRCVQIIRDTVATTQAELGSLPLPTVARDETDLRALVGRIRASETSVELRLRDQVPPGTGEVIYRVVQESLTNVMRHAPGSQVTVDIECIEVSDDAGGRAVRVRVTDDGPGCPTGAGRGYGLIGLEERVRFAGGSLTLRQRGPGFAVEAVLPVPAGSTLSDVPAQVQGESP